MRDDEAKSGRKVGNEAPTDVLQFTEDEERSVQKGGAC